MSTYIARRAFRATSPTGTDYDIAEGEHVAGDHELVAQFPELFEAVLIDQPKRK